MNGVDVCCCCSVLMDYVLIVCVDGVCVNMVCVCVCVNSVC